MHVVEECIEPVYDKIRYDLHRGAKHYYGENISPEEAREVIKGAVWICRQQHPDLAKDALITEAVRYLYKDYCEYLQAARLGRSMRKTGRRNRVAREFGDQMAVTPWGEAFIPMAFEDNSAQPVPVAVVPAEESPEHVVYETKLSELSVQNILAKLIDVLGDRDEVALAWVLLKGYGFSVPTILGIWGITEDMIGARAYGALRKKVWETLLEVDKTVKTILEEEGVEELKTHFKQ